MKDLEVFPIPCTEMYENAKAQVTKIGQELEEVSYALRAQSIAGGSYLSVAEEVVDVIVAATTLLEGLGYDFSDRQRLINLVNTKNAARGYY